MNRVDVEPLRERFLALRERGEVSAAGLAREMGWMREVPESSRLARTLGVVKHDGGNGPRRRETISAETAVRLGALLGLDPWEVGV